MRTFTVFAGTSLKEAYSELIHKNLIEKFKGPRRVVYMGKIREECDYSLVKIGSTVKIQNRAKSLRKSFGQMRFFKIYESEMYLSFEDFLLNHPDIAKLQYTDEIHKGKKSSEVFLMKPGDIDNMIDIADRRLNALNMVEKIFKY